jgi:predicted MFS family arabinose efflux permease
VTTGNATPTEPLRSGRLPVIIALGATQTLAWASSAYLPAIIAAPMSSELRCSTVWIFAAVSMAVLISGLIGPRIGKRIDRVGGRGVLALSNVVLASGLTLLATAHSFTTVMLAWVILGLGMGLGLYDAAFATLGRLYGSSARSAITGIALMAGFASTIGWPLSAWGVETIGWRGTCFAWAAAHVLVALPVNLLMIPAPVVGAVTGENSPPPHIEMDRNMWLLAIALAAVWFVAGAMAAHLPTLIEAAGASHVEAVAAAALMGPAQVIARIAEATILSGYHPLVSARLAALAHPAAAVVLVTGGATFGPLFACLHGAGNGILTIARGTVPLAIYGPENYGYRLGLLGAPARIAQAAAPVLCSLLIEKLGANALSMTALLGAITFAALLQVKQSK